MLKELIHKSRNAALQSLVDAYYGEAKRKYSLADAVATQNLIDAIYSVSLDHVAEHRSQTDFESRMFIVECMWKGRDKRFMTVYKNSLGTILVDVNPKVNEKEFVQFQRMFIEAIIEASYPKIK